MKDYDCRTCGACCISEYDSPHYVDLEPGEERKLSAYHRKRLVVYPNRYDPELASLATKREPGTGHVVCAAHRGRTGTQSACGIYENRPEVCRAFRPGNAACRSARRDIGLPEGPR